MNPTTDFIAPFAPEANSVSSAPADEQQLASVQTATPPASDRKHPRGVVQLAARVAPKPTSAGFAPPKRAAAGPRPPMPPAQRGQTLDGIAREATSALGASLRAGPLSTRPNVMDLLHPRTQDWIDAHVSLRKAILSRTTDKISKDSWFKLISEHRCFTRWPALRAEVLRSFPLASFPVFKDLVKTLDKLAPQLETPAPMSEDVALGVAADFATYIVRENSAHPDRFRRGEQWARGKFAGRDAAGHRAQMEFKRTTGEAATFLRNVSPAMRPDGLLEMLASVSGTGLMNAGWFAALFEFAATNHDSACLRAARDRKVAQREAVQAERRAKAEAEAEAEAKARQTALPVLADAEAFPTMQQPAVETGEFAEPVEPAKPAAKPRGAWGARKS